MKKYDLIKMTGWIAVAIGGLVASWATDKQSKEEINKKLEEYITEKTDKRRENDSEERLNKLLTAIFAICDASDFHIEERIVVKDKRTGKIWR